MRWKGQLPANLAWFKQTGLSSPDLSEEDAEPAFSVQDLSASAITDFQSDMAGGVAELAIMAMDDEYYRLSLSFSLSHLSLPQAAAMLKHLAQCAGEPVRHLL